MVKIVGAGLFGCTCARLLADAGIKVCLIDSRKKIGGNCSSTYVDGIEVHDYGSHIFHTDNEKVWKFINRFTKFNDYIHHVVAKHNGNTYMMPFNLSLINQFYGNAFSPLGAKNAIANDIMQYKLDHAPTNLEEQACSLVGKRLYDAFIKNYTAKQWHEDPIRLSPDIIKRIPIRYTYNTNYFNDKYQGIPLYGYNEMFKNLISSPNISVGLQLTYKLKDILDDEKFNNIVIYTGALDKLFDYEYGQLQWRSLRFEQDNLALDDFQGNSCINYVDADVEYTRIHEYKHYHPEIMVSNKRTIIQREYPTDWTLGKECYYPVNNSETNSLHAKYLEKAKSIKNLYVGGRLGLYKYFDMDDTIAAAFELIDTILKK